MAIDRVQGQVIRIVPHGQRTDAVRIVDLREVARGVDGYLCDSATRVLDVIQLPARVEKSSDLPRWIRDRLKPKIVEIAEARSICEPSRSELQSPRNVES